jgi:glycosyltransferase involved in cell wall biosynthesis
MIVITTYHEKQNDKRFLNRRRYLDETIKSIDNQQIESVFHILVDDGSDEETFKYLFRKYNEPDKRIVLRREKKIDEPLTSTNARNFAINFCLENNSLDIKENDYISFIDSDDVLINFNKRVNYLFEHESDFLYTDSLLFFNNDNVCYRWEGLNPDNAYNIFWITGKMPYPTMTWKVSFLKKLKIYIQERYNTEGLFDPEIGCGEDVDVAMSSFECAHKNNLKISYLPEITAGYRIHNHSLATIRNQHRRKIEEKLVIKRHFKDKTNLLYLKRFFIRPECTIAFLMIIKNLFRKRLYKKDFL